MNAQPSRELLAQTVLDAARAVPGVTAIYPPKTTSRVRGVDALSGRSRETAPRAGDLVVVHTRSRASVRLDIGVATTSSALLVTREVRDAVQAALLAHGMPVDAPLIRVRVVRVENVEQATVLATATTATTAATATTTATAVIES